MTIIYLHKIYFPWTLSNEHIPQGIGRKFGIKKYINGDIYQKKIEQSKLRCKIIKLEIGLFDESLHLLNQ